MARKKSVKPVTVKAGAEVAEVVVQTDTKPAKGGAKKPAKPSPSASHSAKPASASKPTKKPAKPAKAAKPAAPAVMDGLRQRLDESASKLEEFGKHLQEVTARFDALEALITAGAGQLAEATQRAESEWRELREEAGRRLEDERRQAAERSAAELRELRELREAVAQEIDALRGQAAEVEGQDESQREKAAEQAERSAVELRALRESVAREIDSFRREAAEAAAQAGTELSTAAAQVDEASRKIAESGESLLAGLQGELAPLRQSLQQVQPHLQALPGQAESLAEGLRELERQDREARDRLRKLQEQVTAAELHLSVVQQQVREAEGRADNARSTLARAEIQGEHAEAPPSRRHLGLTVGPGVVVAEVDAGSPAGAAGLTPGDVIAAVNGTAVLNGGEVRSLVQESPAEVRLSVIRDGQAAELTAHKPAEGEEGNGKRFGLVVGPGIVVAEVEPDSEAEAIGLMPGDLIESIDGVAVQTGTQVRQLVQLLAELGAIRLGLRRAGEAREVTVGGEEKTA